MAVGAERASKAVVLLAAAVVEEAPAALVALGPQGKDSLEEALEVAVVAAQLNPVRVMAEKGATAVFRQLQA